MGVAEQLQVEVRHMPDRVIIALAGELDMASAPLLQNTIDSAELESATLIVLDLQGLQFIDSTGLRVILGVRKRCVERDQELAVTRGSQQVERLLAVTGVGDHLHTLESAEQPID